MEKERKLTDRKIRWRLYLKSSFRLLSNNYFAFHFSFSVNLLIMRRKALCRVFSLKKTSSNYCRFKKNIYLCIRNQE